VLVTFYVVVFIYDSYYSIHGVMDVNTGVFGGVLWISVSVTETVIHVSGFMVLTYFCSSTTCEVRRWAYFFNIWRVPVIRPERDRVTVV
jgi:hypothetical protein